MTIPTKTEHLEPPLPGDGTDSHAGSMELDEDEEERAFLREMMKESRRTIAKMIERLYGPIEMSE